MTVPDRPGSRHRRPDRGGPEPSLERARRQATGQENPLPRWESLAERRIREAMEAGAFDNLPGRGRPLDLRDDPYVDSATRIANQLLRNNGFSLPWIERGRDLEADRARLLEALDRARGRDRAVWGRAVETFREAVASLNRRIRDHNLDVPVPGMILRRLDADAETASRAP